ncbi:MAG TPA: phosphatase PAP2 family protein [Desulfuromonadales bacterium]|nr:phosphatase PAP2 family protein [Desulfuromonadales bacterium]
MLNELSKGGGAIVGSYARRITLREMLFMQRFCDLRRHSWLTVLFRGASRLGDGPLWWACGLMLLVVGGPPGRRAFFAAALAIASSILLFKGIKNLIGRPRPYVTWPDLPCLLAPPDRFSFPSGHTMTAFAAWAAISAILPATSAFLLPAAVLIGASRVFLGLHYPSDVLVGALIGSGLGVGAVQLLQCQVLF